MNRGTECLKQAMEIFGEMTVQEYRELYDAECEKYDGPMLTTVLETPEKHEAPSFLEGVCVKMCN